ncbi:hypothetical protein C5O00_12660 [Pukyongia salina]|uniref:Uncharacterized protein n=1 Tax=Pukyongia salina TaxID=2094025 RepID=A0A2S0HZ56_9FLAO|nr:hypothetical protein [Pukyongia salina]AVI51957.1 hypothetical protein C5O00_12660 [Pukyongia salina]
MTKSELFKNLTESQKIEFNNDIKNVINEIISSGHIYQDKLHEVDINMRLEDSILLNVTLGFIVEDNLKIKGVINNIIKLDNVDDYLDSINKSKSLDDNWINPI